MLLVGGKSGSSLDLRIRLMNFQFVLKESGTGGVLSALIEAREVLKLFLHFGLLQFANYQTSFRTAKSEEIKSF